MNKRLEQLDKKLMNGTMTPEEQIEWDRLMAEEKEDWFYPIGPDIPEDLRS